MMSRKWKILTGLLTPVLLGVLLVAVEHVRGKWTLHHETASLREQGERLTVAELLPEPFSSETNGAPRFTGAASLLNGQVVPNEVPGAWRTVLPGKVRLTTQFRQWPRPSSSSATNLLTAEELAQDIQGAQEHLVQIHTALRQPALQFSTTYSFRALMLPHLSVARRGAQWLRAASLNALLKSDLEGSLLCLESGAALPRKLADEPMLISQLVALAIAQISIGATWEALQSPGWTEAKLVRLQGAWMEPNYVARMARAMEMERAMGHDDFTKFTDDELQGMLADWSSALLGSGGTPSLPTAVEEVPAFMQTLVEYTPKALQRIFYLPLWRAAWADQDHARLLRLWQDYIVAARRAATSNSLQAAKAVLPAHATGAGRVGWPESGEPGVYDRYRFLVSNNVGGGNYRAIQRACVTEASRRMAVTAIAMQRYRLRHGKCPSTLDALVPEFLPVVPLDPMDSQPLRYQFKSEARFVLYSVGEDGVDDGGDARPSTSYKGWPLVQNGRDLVWPDVATAQEIAEVEAKSKPRRR